MPPLARLRAGAHREIRESKLTRGVGATALLASTVCSRIVAEYLQDVIPKIFL
jgi:hypothetical protein